MRTSCPLAEVNEGGGGGVQNPFGDNCRQIKGLNNVISFFCAYFMSAPDTVFSDFEPTKVFKNYNIKSNHDHFILFNPLLIQTRTSVDVDNINTTVVRDVKKPGSVFYDASIRSKCTMKRFTKGIARLQCTVNDRARFVTRQW
eukprot:gene23541-29765_t